jgi:hypothetical protein
MILLVNFTQEEADKLSSSLPLIVERGFLSDALNPSREINKSSPRVLSEIDIYLPHPVYEYRAVFINLNSNPTIETEFSGKVRPLTEQDRSDFGKYWVLWNGIMTIFLGDYEFSDLFDICLQDIYLKPVINKDKTINSVDSARGGEIVKLFNELKSRIMMPTNHYISMADKSPLIAENSLYKSKEIYWNGNGDDLAIFIDDNRGYSKTDKPYVVVLPQFKDNMFVVEKLLKQFAKLYPKHIPELPSSDWIDLDDYYPSVVNLFDEQIFSMVEDTKKKIEVLRQGKEDAKEKFKSLRGLLTETGDELKGCVINVLGDIFKVSVTDADDINGDSLLKEDLVIDLDDRKILVEVKGVVAENPSPAHIVQVLKHMFQSKDKANLKGALILNYDLKTDPSERHLAYKGEQDEQALEGVIFIDTRVMFALALAVIDFNMPTEKAVTILFQEGRVTFDLDEYITSNKTITPEATELMEIRNII